LTIQGECCERRFARRCDKYQHVCAGGDSGAADVAAPDGAVDFRAMELPSERKDSDFSKVGKNIAVELVPIEDNTDLSDVQLGNGLLTFRAFNFIDPADREILEE